MLIHSSMSKRKVLKMIKLLLLCLICIKVVSANPLRTSDELLQYISPKGTLNLKSVQYEDVKKNISFLLFTPKNPNTPEYITLDNVLETSYDPKLPTKIFSHGWTQTGQTKWAYEVKNQYLSKYECNFISVDWRNYSRSEYSRSASATKLVGQVTGNLIVTLISKYGVTHKNFHVIGISLGGHVAGFTGKTVFAITGKKVARVTGLDPAGPLFEFPITVGAHKRIDKEDAEFVDIIHTNGRQLGMIKPVGVANFYPNNGYYQIGCEQLICSHGRSLEYFLESITSTGFLSIKCDSWEDYNNGICDSNEVIPMGEPTPNTASGLYFLKTASQSPYALNNLLRK